MCGLEVLVVLVPLLHWRHDAEVDNLLAHVAEVLVALLQVCHLLLCARRSGVVDASLVDSCRQSHHHVLDAELRQVCVAASRQCERLAAHSGLDHLHGVVGRALE